MTSEAVSRRTPGRRRFAFRWRRAIALVFISMCALSAADVPRAAIPYFSSDRELRLAAADRQNYLVVDETVWDHARSDLGDLRLYDGSGSEIPYALTREGEETRRTPLVATLFNLAQGPHGTEFVLEIPPAANGLRQYDRVTLDLSATDFIGNAQVEGADVVSSSAWAKIGAYSIFDLSREKLGRNFELYLPPQRYRFLRIVLHAPVKPEEVKGATIADVQTRAAAWIAVGSAPVIGKLSDAATLAGSNESPQVVLDRGRMNPGATLVRWNESEQVPLDRIHFDVSGTENFSRGFELFDEQGHLLASGEISRVRLQRGGEKVDSKRLDAEIPGVHLKQAVMLIYNGDDPPLAITQVQPQSVQRRLYFEPRGRSGIKLYYGDKKANAPVYDYAKFFQRDGAATLAELGPEQHNVAYTGRPDDRPWTERHGWVVWAALVVAIVVLGTVALRGMKS